MTTTQKLPILAPADVYVLHDLLRFGVLALDHIARRFKLDSDASLARLATLIEQGLAKKKPDWFGEGVNIFVATELARRVAPIGVSMTDMTPEYIRHDLTVVDVADWFLEQHPNAVWRTERQLRNGQRRLGRRQFDNSSGPPHPDGLVLMTNRRIAVEVELSAKADSQYARIFLRYARAAAIDEVRWYVRDARLREHLQLLIERHGFGASLPMTAEPLPTARVWSWA